MTKKLKCPEGGITYKIPGGDPIFTDPEFQAFLGQATPEKRARLEQNLIEDKRATDPIIIWWEARIILDGHNRIEICQRLKIAYRVMFMKFPLTPEGRNQALDWALNHQYGRRDLPAEGLAKIVEFRRARVAAMREEGASIRTIAEKEKVSPKTVVNDLAKSGVEGSTPDKTTGADGKQYPSKIPSGTRCVNGQYFCSRECMNRQNDPDKCKKCIALNAKHAPPEPGDGRLEEAQAQAAKQEARTDPKNGQEDFNWAHFNSEFARFFLNVDKMGKAYRKHNTPEATKLREDLMNWKNAFKKWAETISRKKPVPDAVDRIRNGKGK